MTAAAYANLTAVDGTTSTAQLGQEFNSKGATWMYVKASATCSAYKACIVAADGTIQPITTALATGVVADVVIPQFDFASGDYGWAPVGPFNLREDNVSNFKVSALTLDAVNAIQYTTATPGSVDDTATVQIKGLRLLSTVGGSTADTACVAESRLTVNA